VRRSSRSPAPASSWSSPTKTEAPAPSPATNINYRNGRTSFAFAVDDVMVSFSGPSEARGGDLVTLNLDIISIASDKSGC
jgi:hypothetical protein